MNEKRYICPNCKSLLREFVFESIDDHYRLICENCKSIFPVYDGCVDFTIGVSDEKKFFEKRYSTTSQAVKKNLDFNELRMMWNDIRLPSRKIVLKMLDDEKIKNKVVLLLGNGNSTKELYFLARGGKIIFSDLSLFAVLSIKNQFDFEGRQIEFHAIDANRIPFEEEYIDVLIGFNFVHHLGKNSLDSFLKEVKRVLKVDGLCLFTDGAYSKIWQKMKFSRALKPLYDSYNRVHKVSSEDMKSRIWGGFRKEELSHQMKKHRFSEMIFVRFGFLRVIYHRFFVLYFRLYRFPKLDRIIAHFLYKIDNLLEYVSNFYSNNTLMLVWGFRK